MSSYVIFSSLFLSFSSLFLHFSFTFPHFSSDSLKRTILAYRGIQRFRSRSFLSLSLSHYCSISDIHIKYVAYQGIIGAIEHYKRAALIDVIGGLKVAQMKLNVTKSDQVYLKSVCEKGISPALRQMLL